MKLAVPTPAAADRPQRPERPWHQIQYLKAENAILRKRVPRLPEATPIALYRTGGTTRRLGARRGSCNHVRVQVTVRRHPPARLFATFLAATLDVGLRKTFCGDLLAALGAAVWGCAQVVAT